MSRTDVDVVIRRVLAFAIDALVVAGATWPVGTNFARTPARRLAATAALAAVGGLPYHVVLEGRYGRTVGKAVAGVVVTSEGGDRPTSAAATTRTVLRFVDWLPVGYLLGLASIAVTERDQRIGDLVAGTVVERDG